MIRLLKFLITGSFHEHEWEEIDCKIVKYFEEGSDLPDYSYHYYIYKCKKCGIHKSKKIKVG
jgi:hypothetical protein